MATLTLGTILGLLHFGGLWLTVRVVLRWPRRAAVWLAVSGLARLAGLGLVLALFLKAGDAGPMVAALAGFWLGRSLLTRGLGGGGHGA